MTKPKSSKPKKATKKNNEANTPPKLDPFSNMSVDIEALFNGKGASAAGFELPSGVVPPGGIGIAQLACVRQNYEQCVLTLLEFVRANPHTHIVNGLISSMPTPADVDPAMLNIMVAYDITNPPNTNMLNLPDAPGT